MKQYIVDAFADKLFEGNPAAICVMEQWPEDERMNAIAMENNLSETAFAVKEGACYHLRWFTPGGEIDLCGHATLATAYVLMNAVDTSLTEVHFQTLSGELVVKRRDDLYEMDFPSYHLKPIEVTDQMAQIIGFRPVEAWIGRDLVCILENEEQVKTANPDLEKAKLLPGLILQITAKGTDYDCVSRSFAPKLNVPEDPVCGSGHCHIAPLWSNKLGQKELVARQASRRGGTLYCRVDSGRVQLAGKAVLYSTSELFLPDEKRSFNHMRIPDGYQADTLYQRVSKSFEKQSFLSLIGAKIEHVAKGQVTISCERKDTLLQQQGLLHGGVITTLADVAGGYAALTMMPDHSEVLTVELKINLMRPAFTDKVIAISEVIKAGKTLVIVETTVVDEENKILAKMISTMFATGEKGWDAE